MGHELRSANLWLDKAKGGSELGEPRTSTRPVYNRIPELNESRTPLTMFAVLLFGLYVVRTPRPAAIPIGVVRPYKMAASTGT